MKKALLTRPSSPARMLLQKSKNKPEEIEYENPN